MQPGNIDVVLDEHREPEHASVTVSFHGVHLPGLLDGVLVQFRTPVPHDFALWLDSSRAIYRAQGVHSQFYFNDTIYLYTLESLPVEGQDEASVNSKKAVGYHRARATQRDARDASAL
jgi:hypothetical protein